MSARTGNIFNNTAKTSQHEVFETLFETKTVTIERILSYGQASLEGEWYDQERHEWVLLAAGSAGVLFEGESMERVLQAGDYLEIPAHCRHRVAWTDPAQATVWLAVHFN